MNLALSAAGNIIRTYKKYGDGTANHPRNGRLRKINGHTSRWISRNVQINPLITRPEIKTNLEGAEINVSKLPLADLYIVHLSFKITKKSALLKTKHVKDRLKFVETYEKKGMQFGKKVIWSDETKVELFRRNTATSAW